tara:strand:- start:7778 stop:8266 length:489 start_codon:yes stop_codon:yes gene_type:complete
MIIHVKNKNTLIIDDFKLECSVGKNGFNSNKKEGDHTTPKGLFKLQKLYFRKDRVKDPKCKLPRKVIQENMAWCDDPDDKNYNKEIKTKNKKLKEYLYREDHKYDYVISFNYNKEKIPNKGSAIFLHLTDNYNPTAGCIALKKKDFEILIQLIDKNTKIKIN